jgi:AAHS family 4-hydroxybenzoate transporter-like MFS transporter
MTSVVHAGLTRPRPWVSTLALLLALVCEGYDLQAANFAAPAIVQAFDITKAQVGPLLSANLLGVLFGAAFIGPLGARLGRKRLIIAGCSAYGVLSLVAARATMPPELIFVRFLIGLGLGGVLPNALALASELARRGAEATAAALIGIGNTFAGVVAGLAAAALISHYGWQPIVLVGGVLPLLIVVLLQLLLPESLAFVARRARREVTHGGNRNRLPGPAPLFRAGPAGQTLAIWLTFIAILMCVYLLSGWIPLLLNQSGFSASSSALIGAAYQGGGVVVVAVSLMLKRSGWDVVAVPTIPLRFAATVWVRPSTSAGSARSRFCSA